MTDERATNLPIVTSLVVAAAAGIALAAVAAPLADRGTTRIDRNRPQLVTLGRLRSALEIAPGDRIERPLTLGARGKGVRGLSLAVGESRQSRLDDARSGLRLSIARCPHRWRRHGEIYRCSGKVDVVLPRVPLVGQHALAHTAIRRGADVFLLLKVTLPKRAGEAFEDQRSTLVYRFTTR